MYEGEVVIHITHMNGRFDKETPEVWREEYPTEAEAQLFVDYWKNYEPRPGIGNVEYISGSVKEID